MQKIDAKSLVGEWLHSFEEDSAKQTVYRRSGFAFPPARGRAAFHLESSQRWTDLPISARDGHDRKPLGHWKVADDGVLQLVADEKGRPAQALRIISADPDRLVVEKSAD